MAMHATLLTCWMDQNSVGDSQIVGSTSTFYDAK